METQTTMDLGNPEIADSLSKAEERRQKLSSRAAKRLESRGTEFWHKGRKIIIGMDGEEPVHGTFIRFGHTKADKNGSMGWVLNSEDQLETLTERQLEELNPQ